MDKKQLFYKLYWSLFSLVLVLFSVRETQANPTVIVISGGDSEVQNNERYYTKIKQLMEIFPASSWNHYHLVADGPGSSPNSLLLGEDGLPSKDQGGNIRLTRRDPPPGAVMYQSATSDHIQEAFQKASQNLNPGDPVFIYVSDHGSLDPTSGRSIIRLWKSNMKSEEFKKNVSIFKEGQKVVMAFDQCFGGDLAEELLGIEGSLFNEGKNKNICGFSAANPGRTASSNEQLVSLLYQSIHDEKAKSSVIDPETNHYQLQELLNQAHLNFTTHPLSTSEIFLLGYMKSKHGQSESRNRVSSSNCRNENPVLNSGSMSEMKDSVLLQQVDFFKSWQSKIKLSSDEIEKLKKKCKSINNIDVSDPSALSLALDECELDLERYSRRLSQTVFQSKNEIGDLYLKSLPTDLQSIPEKIKKVQKTAALIRKNLAEEEEKDQPNLDKITRMKKGLENKKNELAQLEVQARPIREGQKAAFSGDNPEFNQFLERQNKKHVFNQYLIQQEAQKELMALKSHVAKVKHPEQLLAALSAISNDSDALSKYLTLLKCETELLGKSR